MSKIRVNLGARSYDINIGCGLLESIGNDITDLNLGRKCVIITDDKVGNLYSEQVLNSLTDAGYAVGEVRLPQGELNKSLDNVERCYHEMLCLGLDRKSFVVALGGGLIGDLAGFAAATFMRGISFIQVPTTLLADVDASIGGKTGVNLKEGKNLVGAFHQPRRVYIDIDTLKTLEERDIKSGFVEVLKHAIIKDQSFYSFLEQSVEKILSVGPQAMETAISTSCKIKANVVEGDERETGQRALLNFGHTAGHAIESLSIDMGRPYRHGEAIAIGMAVALDLSVRCGYMSAREMKSILKFMDRCGLPTSCDFLRPEDIVERMKIDKKMVDNKLRFILLKRIGESFVIDNIPSKEMLESIKTGCTRHE